MNKKILLILLLMLVFILPAKAVWINQVYYDPIGSETYGEALELYNPTNTSIDISNWIIATTSSETDVKIPENTFIESYGYFLIADEGWNESKDNETWKNAELEEKMTLKNTNGAVAIKDNEGNIIDAVGWGDEEEIPTELFEGTPATKVKAGESLLRIEDTNDNSKDFVATKPYFFTTGELIINADIGGFSENSNIEVLADDDSNAEGIQIFPNKGSNRKIKVKTNSPGILLFGNQIYNLTQADDGYETIIEIPFSLQPGIYTIKTNNEETNIEILPIKGLSINQRKLDLIVTPGSYDTKKIKITNTGNTEITIYAKSQKFTSIKQDLEGHIAILGKIIDEQWKEITQLGAGANSEIEIILSAKEEAIKGEYKAVLSFKAE